METIFHYNTPEEKNYIKGLKGIIIWGEERRYFEF